MFLCEPSVTFLITLLICLNIRIFQISRTCDFSFAIYLALIIRWLVIIYHIIFFVYTFLVEMECLKYLH
jgi:hypothetical protein